MRLLDDPEIADELLLEIVDAMSSRLSAREDEGGRPENREDGALDQLTAPRRLSWRVNRRGARQRPSVIDHAEICQAFRSPPIARVVSWRSRSALRDVRTMNAILQMLSGVDLRSEGRAAEVADLVISDPDRLTALAETFCNLALDRSESEQAIAILLEYLDDKSRIVTDCAAQALGVRIQVQLLRASATFSGSTRPEKNQ